MNRRLFSLFLAAVLLLSTVAVSAPEVSAAGDWKASDKIIDMIKEFEGFRSKPYEDNGQYSIGYGTRCEDPDKYKDGITKDEAEKMLKDTLKTFETKVNNFITTNNLVVSQNQFDALLSFTYNLGYGWLTGSSLLRTAVINGVTGNEFLYAITMWCNASGQILPNLVKRRLIEANIYLNNIYSMTVPTSFDHVFFDTQMDGAANTTKIQGYDSSWNSPVIPAPTKSGWKFLGWYTKASGGEWVTNLTDKHAGTTLYGHWQEGSGTAEGTAASYVHVTTRETAVYGVPNGTQVKLLAEKTSVTVTADLIDNNGVKWGRTKDGWISLATTRPSSGTVVESTDPVNVMVKTNGVNIRKGPGTNYNKAGTANEGDILTITEIQRGVNYLWGKFEGGWICLDYTNYKSVINGTEEEPDPSAPVNGVIKGTDTLRIRNLPGTVGTQVVGTYKQGDIVTITAQQKVGDVTWGMTKKGWISLHYVDLKTDVEGSEADPDDYLEGIDPDDITAIGVIINATQLRVRNLPGTEGTKVVGTYNRGDTVAITTQQKVGKTTWGLTKKGWISLYYVELSPVDNGSEDSGETVMATGVIVDTATLRVREGPGTNYRKVGSLAAGTEVKIYQTSGAGHHLWGRIKGGWISMNYVELDGGISNAGGKIGVVYNCLKLNVRKEAGTDQQKVARLDAGTEVEILDRKIVKDVVWGKISMGWVSMEYIKLTGETAPDSDDPEIEVPDEDDPDEDDPDEETPDDEQTPGEETPDEEGPTVKVGTIVGTTELRIRKNAGTQYEKVGVLKKGDRVIIKQTVKVGTTTWGQIDQGWIHMHYVQLDKEEVPEGSVFKTVTTELRIRSGPGTGNKQVGSYKKGDVVLIFEQTVIRNTIWGHTDKGWISMDYVK